MSSQEFSRWQGYLRQSPVGWRWLNLQYAELKREIAKGRTLPGKQYPRLDEFVWKPPEPFFVTRKKKEAKALRARKAKGSPQ